MRRTATCDTELGGKQILKDDQVLMWYLSANRDEDVFGDNAEAIDLERPNADRHLSFVTASTSAWQPLGRATTAHPVGRSSATLRPHRGRRRTRTHSLCIHQRLHQAASPDNPQALTRIPAVVSPGCRSRVTEPGCLRRRRVRQGLHRCVGQAMPQRCECVSACERT